MRARESGRPSATAEKAYLSEFGVGTDEAAARDLWFRGLALPQTERAAAKRKLNPALAPLEALGALYGSARVWRGILVIGPKGFSDTGTLETLAKAVPFFDPAFLTRITVVTPSGLAAYLPETDSLVLSRELLEKPNALHRFVILHELTHLAQRRAGKDWDRAFSRLADPGEPKFQPVDDELTRLSAGSPYSLLPDGVAPEHVVARGYREAKARGEVGEEIADAVAAYLVVPSRFEHAPKTRRWIESAVLHRRR